MSRQNRKKLRKDIKEFTDDLQKDPDLLENPHSESFDINRQKLNNLFEKVLHARESYHDAQNVYFLARSVKNAATHLDDISRRYDFSSFAASLQGQYNRGNMNLFSWVDFGRDVGVISRKRQELCTMFGPVGE